MAKSIIITYYTNSHVNIQNKTVYTYYKRSVLASQTWSLQTPAATFPLPHLNEGVTSSYSLSNAYMRDVVDVALHLSHVVHLPVQ